MLQLNQWAKVVARQVGAWVWGVEVDGSATNNEDQGFERPSA
jgi:hypothetical protein